MKYYTDITLLPGGDIGVHFLWTKVMTQIHLALVEIQDENKKVPVAASFPEYREKQENKQGFVGNKLRLLAVDKTDLERLNLANWFDRFSDYVHIKAIREVPPTDTYESFTREKFIGSVDRLIRRRIKRHNETEEQAKKYFAGYKAMPDQKDYPFIKIKSLSSEKNFCLIIARKDQTFTPTENQLFNTYGLNAKGVLPKFKT